MKTVLWLFPILAVLGGFSAVQAADSPWRHTTVSRLDQARPGAEAAAEAGPQKYLQIGMQYNDPSVLNNLDRFRIVDEAGKEIGEYWGNDPKKALIFEAKTRWDSLNGLYLDGFGHREPLFQQVAAPRPVVTAPATIEPPVVQRPAIERPVVQRPVVEQPIVDRPASEYRDYYGTVPEREVVVQRPRDNVYVGPPVVDDGVLVDDRAVVHDRVVVEDRDVVVRGHDAVIDDGLRYVGGRRRVDVYDDDDRIVVHHRGGGAVYVGGGGGVGSGGGSSGGGAGYGGGGGVGAGHANGDGKSAGSGDSASAGGSDDVTIDDPTVGNAIAKTTGVNPDNISADKATGSGGGAGRGFGSGGGSGSGSGDGPGRGAGKGSGSGDSADSGSGDGSGSGKGTGSGTSSDGSGKSGAGPDGSGKDGSGKDGSGKDGSGKDGSGKDSSDAGNAMAKADGSGKGDGAGDGGNGQAKSGSAQGSGKDGKGQDANSCSPDAQANGAGSGQGSGDGLGSGPESGPGTGPGPGSGPAGPGGPGGSGGPGGPGGPGGSGGPGYGGPGYGGPGYVGPEYVGPRVKSPYVYNPYRYRVPYVYNPYAYYAPYNYNYSPYAPSGPGSSGPGSGGSNSQPSQPGSPDHVRLPPPGAKLDKVPELVLYVTVGSPSGPGKVYQVKGTDGDVIGKVNLPTTATGIDMYRDHGVVLASPRDGGKIMEIDDSGKLSMIIEKDPQLPHPVKVSMPGNSDTMVIADDFSGELVMSTIAGTKTKVYQKLSTHVSSKPMSVAVTNDKGVVFSSDAEPGVHKFMGDQSASGDKPILPASGGVAADHNSLRWAAAQGLNAIKVYEGQQYMKTLRLPPNKKFYKNGLMSFGPDGTLCVAVQDDEEQGDVWILAYQVDKEKVTNSFKWTHEEMQDFAVGNRMLWERNDRLGYKSEF